MAKQRGIHQIRGKIDNLSYYEQKYVRGGLIRRINAAMSERLKTDSAFANTRTANELFGGCSLYASSILSCFGQRSVFLFKPYRQALLTKAIFSAYKSISYPEKTSNIFFSGVNVRFLISAVDSIVKNKISANFPSIVQFKGALPEDGEDFIYITKEDLENYCKINNCTSVQLSLLGPIHIYNSSKDENSKKYEYPEVARPTRTNIDIWNTGGDDVEFSFDTGSDDGASTFLIFTARPVLSLLGGRPVLGNKGSVCGIVGYYYQ